MYTRRDFTKIGLGVLPLSWAMRPLLAAPANATVGGVRMGIESYSFATLPHATAVDTQLSLMKEMGLAECNLWETLITPAAILDQMAKARAMGTTGAPPTPEKTAAIAAANDALHQWRMTVPLDTFKDLRRRFNAAGIAFYAYTPAVPTATTTDEEMQRNCEMTLALGAKCIISSMPKSIARRFIPMAERYDLKLGIQGRPKVSSTDPDAISTPADYIEAASYAKGYGVWMDTGDATAGGFDVLSFVKENHAHIVGLNIKDRRKDNTSMPWGQGDAHVKELLQFVRDNKLPIRCYIDCDYKTEPNSTREADIRQCLRYAKQVLEA